MSSFDSPPRELGGPAPADPIDPVVVDQLVDGELPDAERRQLLEKMDRTPGAWRQCALAFLEAQCWKQAMGSSILETAEAVPAALARPLAAPVRRLGRWRSPAALAAGVLAAWVFGWVAGSGWRPSTSPAPGFLAGQPAAIVPPAAPQEARPPVAEVAQWTAPVSVPRGAADTNADPGEEGWQTVTVRVPDPSGLAIREIPLPVVPVSGVDPSWLQPPPLPPEMCECLRRQGYEIRYQRAIVPAACSDGRCVVMPVDQVEIRYVGNGKFQ